MCEYCHVFDQTRERDKLEYIGSRIVEYNPRNYYRCPHCDQAFYWMDWSSPAFHHLEVLVVSGSDLIVHLGE